MQLVWIIWSIHINICFNCRSFFRHKFTINKTEPTKFDTPNSIIQAKTEKSNENKSITINTSQKEYKQKVQEENKSNENPQKINENSNNKIINKIDDDNDNNINESFNEFNDIECSSNKEPNENSSNKTNSKTKNKFNDKSSED